MLGNNQMRDWFQDGNNPSLEYHKDKLFLYPQMSNIGDGTEAQRPGTMLPDTSRTGVTLGTWVAGGTQYTGGGTAPPNGEGDTWSGYYQRTGRRPVFYHNYWENISPKEYPGGADSTYKRMHSRPLAGFALAGLVLGITDKIGNDLYVPYTDRWMYETEDGPVYDSYGEGLGGDWWATSASAFTDAMWFEYRNNYLPAAPMWVS